MGPAEIIMGVSMMSKMTVEPKVTARLIAIGVPQITITFQLLWRMNIVRPTSTRLTGSIVYLSALYISSETSCKTGVSPVTVTALLSGILSDLSLSIVQTSS